MHGEGEQGLHDPTWTLVLCAVPALQTVHTHLRHTVGWLLGVTSSGGQQHPALGHTRLPWPPTRRLETSAPHTPPYNTYTR